MRHISWLSLPVHKLIVFKLTETRNLATLLGGVKIVGLAQDIQQVT